MGSSHIILTFAGPIVLALVHLLARYVSISDRFRLVWMSFASGAALAYVFIHIFPVIARLAVTVGNESERWHYGEWVFVTALAGTCAYYGVEKYTQADAPNAQNGSSHGEGPKLFLLHIAAFSIYNFLIGYMIIDYPPKNWVDAIAFYGALALHFFLVDQNLRERHRSLYDNAGLWIMAGSVLTGAVAGALDLLPQPLMIAGFAFLAGGMILNILKDELPAESDGRLLPFSIGAGLFGLLFVIA